MKCRNEQCLLNKDKYCNNDIVINNIRDCKNKDVVKEKSKLRNNWTRRSTLLEKGEH